MKYFLRVKASGLWVSSPTNTTTANLSLRGCFGGRYGAHGDENPEITKAFYENIHGPLEVAPRLAKGGDENTLK